MSENHTLELGSSGPEVEYLQDLLVFGGYNRSLYSDGEYGRQTMQAVKSLQAALGVEEDGIFGPKTKDALLNKRGFSFDLQVKTWIEKETLGKPSFWKRAWETVKIALREHGRELPDGVRRIH